MAPLISFVDRELNNCEMDEPRNPIVTVTEKQASQVRAVFGNITQIRDLTKHLLDDLEPTIKNDGKVINDHYRVLVLIEAHHAFVYVD